MLFCDIKIKCNGTVITYFYILSDKFVLECLLKENAKWRTVTENIKINIYHFLTVEETLHIEEMNIEHTNQTEYKIIK